MLHNARLPYSHLQASSSVKYEPELYWSRLSCAPLCSTGPPTELPVDDKARSCLTWFPIFVGLSLPLRDVGRRCTAAPPTASRLCRRGRCGFPNIRTAPRLIITPRGLPGFQYIVRLSRSHKSTFCEQLLSYIHGDMKLGNHGARAEHNTFWR